MFPFQSFLCFFDVYQCHNIIHLGLAPDAQKERLLFIQIIDTFHKHIYLIFLGAVSKEHHTHQINVIYNTPVN